VGDFVDEVEPLGERQQSLRPFDRSGRLVVHPVGAGERSHEDHRRRPFAIMDEVRHHWLEDGDRIVHVASAQEQMAEARRSPGGAIRIVPLAAEVDRGREVALGLVAVQGDRRRLARLKQEIGPFRRIVGHGEGLLDERHGLLVAAQGDGSIGGCPQRDPRLGRQRVGFAALGRVVASGEVVAGEDTGEFLRTQRLEEAGRREVAGLAVPPGERVVGNLPDERLDEPVLATLRRSWVDLEDEQLSAHEGAKARFEVWLRQAGDRRQAGKGE